MEIMAENGVLDYHSVDSLKEISNGGFADEETVESKENVEAEAAISHLQAEIRGSWEFIAASQFLVLFHENYRLESFNTRVNLLFTYYQDFEELLIRSCDRTTLPDIEELVMINVKLLNNLYRSRTVTAKNWLEILPGQFEKRKKIEQEWIEFRSYLGIEGYSSSLDEVGFDLDWSQDLTYDDISLRHKVL